MAAVISSILKVLTSPAMTATANVASLANLGVGISIKYDTRKIKSTVGSISTNVHCLERDNEILMKHISELRNELAYNTAGMGVVPVISNGQEVKLREDLMQNAYQNAFQRGQQVGGFIAQAIKNPPQQPQPQSQAQTQPVQEQSQPPQQTKAVQNVVVHTPQQESQQPQQPQAVQVQQIDAEQLTAAVTASVMKQISPILNIITEQKEEPKEQKEQKEEQKAPNNKK